MCGTQFPGSGRTLFAGELRLTPLGPQAWCEASVTLLCSAVRCDSYEMGEALGEDVKGRSGCDIQPREDNIRGNQTVEPVRATHRQTYLCVICVPEGEDNGKIKCCRTHF